MGGAKLISLSSSRVKKNHRDPSTTMQDRRPLAFPRPTAWRTTHACAASMTTARPHAPTATDDAPAQFPTPRAPPPLFFRPSSPRTPRTCSSACYSTTRKKRRRSITRSHDRESSLDGALTTPEKSDVGPSQDRTIASHLSMAP